MNARASFWSSIACLYGAVACAIWGNPWNAVVLGLAFALLLAGAVCSQPSAVEGFAQAELDQRGHR